MDSRSVGLVVVVLGAVVIVVGLLIMLGGLSWFGRLPGDIRIERDGISVYVPITSMIVVSVVLSFLSWILRRLL